MDTVVILTTPEKSKEEPTHKQDKYIPYDVVSLISCLKRAGVRVSFRDLYLCTSTRKEFIEFIETEKPIHVCLKIDVGCFSEFEDVVKALEDTENYDEYSISVFGTYSNYTPHLFDSRIDCIIQGDPEAIVPAIYRQKKSKDKPIILFDQMSDINLLPYFNFRDIEGIDYSGYHHFLPYKSINYPLCRPNLKSTRNSKIVPQKKNRYFSVTRIMNEITQLFTKYDGIKGVHFEGNFPITNTEFLSFFCEMMESNIKWTCEINFKKISHPRMKRLKRAGCVGVYISLESGSQKIHDYLETGINVENIKSKVEIIRKNGLLCVAYWRAGFPYETEEDRGLTDSLMLKLGCPLNVKNPYFCTFEDKEYNKVVNDKYRFIDKNMLASVRVPIESNQI